MRVRVTNLAAAARGFQAADGITAMVEPGASTLLDLADHPAHDAWVAAGEVKIEPESLPPRDGEGAGRSPAGGDTSSRSREKVSRRSRDG